MAPLKMQRDEDDVAVPYLQTGEQFKCRDPTEVQENAFSDDRWQPEFPEKLRSWTEWTENRS
jgi:hypothetical protein